MVTVLVQGKEVARDSDLNTYISKENIIHQPVSLKKVKSALEMIFFFVMGKQKKSKRNSGKSLFSKLFFFFSPPEARNISSFSLYTVKSLGSALQTLIQSNLYSQCWCLQPLL